MKIKLLIVLACLLGVTTSQARDSFNKMKDLLLIQHDNTGDPDDINCLAVEGSMLLHPDFKKANNSPINVYFVAGTRGNQAGGLASNYQKGAESLYETILGRKGPKWTTTGGAMRSKKWNRVANKIKKKVARVINNGGRVWVMEAGQSIFTSDWLRLLINEDNGINSDVTNDKIYVVQHSSNNQVNTTTTDLNYVKNNTNYNRIPPGFKAGNGTPDYDSKNGAAKTIRKNAANNNNSNATTRAYFIEMERIFAEEVNDDKNPALGAGGIDFTDCVELWWILELGNKADTIAKVYNRYVFN